MNENNQEKISQINVTLIFSKQQSNIMGHVINVALAFI
jgi:transaldolase